VGRITGVKGEYVSVRMALAKLCACACGGALIGGGAAQVAQPSKPAGYAVVKSHHAAPRKRMAISKPKMHQAAHQASANGRNGADPYCDDRLPGAKG
jgi:hypothetical protein